VFYYGIFKVKDKPTVLNMGDKATVLLQKMEWNGDGT